MDDRRCVKQRLQPNLSLLEALHTQHMLNVEAHSTYTAKFSKNPSIMELKKLSQGAHLTRPSRARSGR